MKKINHLVHLVEFRPWPIFRGICLLRITSSLVLIFKRKINFSFFIRFLTIIIFSFLWWRDVIRESLFQGFHTIIVQNGIKLGIILFIFREIIFFFRFFWTYFHCSLSPCIEIGLCWPPISIRALNPFRVPFLNTLVLVSSGVTITLRHHLIILNEKGNISLFFTILLGLFFSKLQWIEYKESFFSISDSVFGRIFFVGTGFHGLHVLIGTAFLGICFYRISFNHFSFIHFIGYELSIWYWHFVDVVWLFLFSAFYWWGF